MAIFKKNKDTGNSRAVAPEGDESPNEADIIEGLNSTEEIVAEESVAEEPEPAEVPVAPEVVETPLPAPELSYREIPVCMSQEQINNLVIENNIMLKQLLAG